MKKKNKIILWATLIFIAVVLLLIGIIRPLLTGNTLYSLNNSSIPIKFCTDSDAYASDPSKVSGTVFTIDKECSWDHLNSTDARTTSCIIPTTYNDFCIDNNVLSERSCNTDNTIASKAILCQSGCVQGRCL